MGLSVLSRRRHRASVATNTKRSISRMMALPQQAAILARAETDDQSNYTMPNLNDASRGYEAEVK